MNHAPYQSGNAVIDGLFEWCVQFLLWLAEVLGSSYYAINIWIFCVVWPLVTLFLVILVIKQYRQIQKLKRAM